MGTISITGSRRPAGSGVTLIEILVVLATVGLLVTLSVPAMTGYARQSQLKAAASQVAGLINLARSTAITTRQEHELLIDIEHGRLEVTNTETEQPLERTVRIPSSIDMRVEAGGEPLDPPKIVFRPTGSLAGRTTTCILSTPKKTRKILVSAATGAITVQ